MKARATLAGYSSRVLAHCNPRYTKQHTKHVSPLTFNTKTPLSHHTTRNQSHQNERNMGTRHLICIYHNGRFVVAQYGQYDGHPSATGMAVLRFLTQGNIKLLRDNIHFAPPPKPFNGEDEYDSRGVAILGDVATATETIDHVFRLDFACDGLFCEWAYVVDLDDAGALEVYKGVFPGATVDTAGLFGKVGVVNQELRARYSFDQLPSCKDEFLEACGCDEDVGEG